MKIGLDWGGTKLEAIALDPVTNEELTRNRIDSPKDDYQDILNAVYNLIPVSYTHLTLPTILLV